MPDTLAHLALLQRQDIGLGHILHMAGGVLIVTCLCQDVSRAGTSSEEHRSSVRSSSMRRTALAVSPAAAVRLLPPGHWHSQVKLSAAGSPSGSQASPAPTYLAPPAVLKPLA